MGAHLQPRSAEHLEETTERAGALVAGRSVNLTGWGAVQPSCAPAASALGRQHETKD